MLNDFSYSMSKSCPFVPLACEYSLIDQICTSYVDLYCSSPNLRLSDLIVRSSVDGGGIILVNLI
jgi:hypothetical protein